MIRDILKIDEEKCDGCGLCVPNCHEGAIRVIDGKLRMISELMCDGLGACIGHCPQDAISIEKREAEPYNERKVMEEMIKKGKNTILAHLKHLQDHNETAYLKEGIESLRENAGKTDFDVDEVINELVKKPAKTHHQQGGGCPGSKNMVFNNPMPTSMNSNVDIPSALSQWPVQLHLLNPNAQYFQGADLLLSADCVAYSIGNFHQKYLPGKRLAIACPKLDSNMEIYLDKLIAMIDEAKINTITIMIMEVPCCGGLLQMVKAALDHAKRKVPVKKVVVGIRGNILDENWI